MVALLVLRIPQKLPVYKNIFFHYGITDVTHNCYEGLKAGRGFRTTMLYETPVLPICLVFS